MADCYPLIVLVKGFDFSLAMFAFTSLQRAFDDDDHLTLIVDAGFQYPHIWQVKWYCDIRCAWLWLIGIIKEIKVYWTHF